MLNKMTNSIIDYTSDRITCFSSSYAIEFEVDEFWETETEKDGKLLICGLESLYHRMTYEYDASLANKPVYLLVRKIDKNGKIGKILFKLRLEEPEFDWKYSIASEQLFKEFWIKYPSMKCYKIYDHHQYMIAQSNVKDFGGFHKTLSNVPNQVLYWMNSNKYFFDLFTSNQINNENRLSKARQRDMEYRGKTYKNIKFPILNNIKSNSGNTDYLLHIVNSYNNINCIKNRIYNTPKLGIDWVDFKSLQKEEQKLNNLINDNFDKLPKNSIGFIDFNEIFKMRNKL